ncbi:MULTISPECIES: hypothetical protein [unclassified Sphingomonas]|uniref:hypothetical protein n=1 Tax=unclassified Sphingomonas TaxID=196159 RepID=UPI0006FCCDAF|nr:MULTISPECIES: hypothetical protein [unclassified Sphingomonas]KQM57146.1 hypothetical protein ASE65_12465 [Sphingomonas sp. Leaf16]KQN10321.1 hypothetical protein ASE81_12510 [Sphingomonas sp. Leaf29]KQN18122.1 hypothetical protein ASE83_12440 [Sphingomonas sp. Leaf32]
MTRDLSPEAASYLALMQTVDIPEGWDVSGIWQLLAEQVAQLMADRRPVLSVGDLSTLAGVGTFLARMATLEREAGVAAGDAINGRGGVE